MTPYGQPGRMANYRVGEGTGSGEPGPVRGRSRVRSIVLAAIPWLVIAGLLVGAFTIRPGGVGKAVVPAPVSAQDHFYGIAYPGNQVLWMVGMLGKIVRSDDGGRSWAVQPSPTKRILQSIGTWSTKRAVAVGDNGLVIVTKDGGRSWQQVKVPLTKVSNKFLRVRVLDNGTAWIVGAMGAVLESTDYGQTWARKVPVHDVTRMDIDGVGKHLWVVGEFGQIIASDDGGKTWQKQSSGVRNTLNGVCFRDVDHGVVVGLQGVILTTSDGGRTWHQVHGVTKEHLFAVDWNGRQWLAVGANGVVLTFGPDAAQWKAKQVAPRDFAWHTGVAAAQDRWYLAGADSGMYHGGNWNAFAKRGDQ